MGEVASGFLIALGIIFLLAVILLALAAFCYSRIKICVQSFRASPDFKLKPASVVGSVVSIITGNFISAAGGFINGVRLDAQLTFLNRSWIPLYIPAIEHEVSIEGQTCPVRTSAMWLAPRGSQTISVNTTLNTNEIPQVVIAGLTHKGNINIEIRSRISFGNFSYVKITNIVTRISDYLPKIGRGKKSESE